jgi:hypothetical protein
MRRKAREEATCLLCSRAFVLVHSGQIFCSKACNQREAERRRKAESRARRLERIAASGGRKKACVECGKPYSTRWDKTEAITCSAKCKNARALKLRKAREATPQPRAVEPPTPALGRVCQNCANWGAKGCVLEAFRSCKPGLVSAQWVRREAASA